MLVSYLERTIELAVENVRLGGGPFAALVVQNGEILATGVNQVTRNNDPTAHAEVVAIREACRILGAFQLSGCDLYTSCEPCPMCLGAIYWARPARVFFAATQEDAARAGFDDAFLYRELALSPADRGIPMVRVDGVNAAEPFAVWASAVNRIGY